MSDARNITLNGPSAAAAELVRNRFSISELSAAARLGIAYALAHDVAVDGGEMSGEREHNFHTGTIDNEGNLVALVRVLRPDDDRGKTEPYRLIGSLMNAGLRKMAQAIAEGDVNDIADLLNHWEGDET